MKKSDMSTFIDRRNSKVGEQKFHKMYRVVIHKSLGLKFVNLSS